MGSLRGGGELRAGTADLGGVPRLVQSRVLHSRPRFPLAGGAAWVALGLMVTRGLRHLARRRRASIAPASDVIRTPDPVAFAVPSRPGRIVVSTAMLEALDEDERRVLYAHERSHLIRHHNRLLHIAEGAAAAVPFLRPLSQQVRFATERWAGEDAGAAVGDRRVVARPSHAQRSKCLRRQFAPLRCRSPGAPTSS